MKKEYLILTALLCTLNCCSQITSTNLLSGYYGDYLEVVIKEKAIYGQFEYFDKWNESVGSYENMCRFYFFGEQNGGDTIPLFVGLPDIENSVGKLVIHGNDSISIYTDFSSDYMPFDFEEGYSVKLNRERDSILALGVVKTQKCFLYSQPPYWRKHAV